MTEKKGVGGKKNEKEIFILKKFKKEGASKEKREKKRKNCSRNLWNVSKWLLQLRQTLSCV